MQVKLRVMRGSNTGKEIGLKGPKFLIGRSEECQLQARSDAISRQHCAILVRSTGLVARDLGSRNGTFVNGNRIEGDQPLQNGDVLQVGPLEFSVIIHVPAATAVPAGGKQAADKVGDLVGQWLDELDEPGPADPASLGQRDTGRFYTDDTEAVTIEPTTGAAAGPGADTRADGAPVPPVDGSTETQAGKSDKAQPAKPEAGKAETGKTETGKAETGKAEPGKSEPGKLPKRDMSADKPKNTQEAAAQMLRKMWNRR